MMQEFIKKIAKKAGDAALEIFGKAEVQYTKSSAVDFVTQADLKADKLIFAAIRDKFPDHGIISEEREPFCKDAEYVWIYDPLDGTRNFASHIPLYGSMIGLTRKSVMELAVIYLPYTKELYFAEKGKGATLNGKSINCSAQKKLDGSSGCVPVGFKPQRVWLLEKLVKKAQTDHMAINFLSSSAVSAAYVASGRRDWIANPGGPSGGIWDHAAPALLLKESGCKVTSLSGEPWKYGDNEVLAANPALHPELFEMINRK